VSDRVSLVVTPEARAYDHGPQHPLRPDRVLLTWDLIRAYALDQRDNVDEVAGRVATDDEIALVHTDEFVRATKRAGHGERGNWRWPAHPSSRPSG
jgi:acetoin utilization protein AcuC